MRSQALGRLQNLDLAALLHAHCSLLFLLYFLDHPLRRCLCCNLCCFLSSFPDLVVFSWQQVGSNNLYFSFNILFCCLFLFVVVVFFVVLFVVLVIFLFVLGVVGFWFFEKNGENTSLAAKGAFAHCLQRCTALRIQNGRKGAS